MPTLPYTNCCLLYVGSRKSRFFGPSRVNLFYFVFTGTDDLYDSCVVHFS